MVLPPKIVPIPETVEQIIVKLRETELHCRAGKTTSEAVRPHSSLGGRTPAPQVIIPCVASAEKVTDRRKVLV